MLLRRKIDRYLYEHKRQTEQPEGKEETKRTSAVTKIDVETLEADQNGEGVSVSDGLLG